MISESVRKRAKLLYDYQCLKQRVHPADAIFVLCSNDLRIGEYAAQLLLKDLGPLLIFSGGVAHQDDLLNTGWDKPEAEVFAERARKCGVPQEKILIENKATNTGENIRFTRKLLEEKSISVKKLLVVQKPYMERRAYATFKKQWPEMEIEITSPPIPYEEYPTKDISEEQLINILVGDVQRIKEYPEKGFQIAQDIPSDVWDAYEQLVEAGFTKHLIKE